MKKKVHKKKSAVREAQHTRRRRRRQKKIALRIVVALLILSGFIYGIVTLLQRTEKARLGEHHAIEGRDHIGSDAPHVPYQTNPPTSGAHGNALRWAIYPTEVTDENAVHNLEHGGIWITYKDLAPEDVSRLEVIARRHPQSALLSPRSANDTPIAVVSWGRVMKLDAIDEAKIEQYITQNMNKSPERLAQ